MQRLVLLLAVLVIGVAPARAATNTYSTGNINQPIGASFAKALTVPQRGPVSFVRVSFRISTPDTSSLAISLVSPKGTEVPLVTNRGAGADFGDGKGCTGTVTVLDADMRTNPVASGQAPFTDNPYRPEGNLASLYGEDAHGKWTLEVTNAGRPAHLQCLTFDIARAVPETLSGHSGGVTATVTYTERNFSYDKLRLKITRSARTVMDLPLQRAGCRDCNDFRPSAVTVRDLDGGEPEVLVDLYTLGAHCCSITLILRWDAAAHRYRSRLVDWGNYGMKLADLDHDGLPELSAFDERFIYAYTAYVFSAAPPQIFEYRQGKLVDATRRFPSEIRKNATYARRQFVHLKKAPTGFDPRTFVAVYVADQYLLGRPDLAKKALDDALAKGILYRGKAYLGTPAGAAFVAQLNRDLRTWGYIT
jgi:subtilisin-like proprotein convertase family protein